MKKKLKDISEKYYYGDDCGYCDDCDDCGYCSYAWHLSDEEIAENTARDRERKQKK